MAEPDREESVSPGTLPSHHDAPGSETGVAPPEQNRSLLPPPNITAERSDLQALGVEARDYWNEGLAHKQVSPARSQPSKRPDNRSREPKTDSKDNSLLGAHAKDDTPTSRRSINFARGEGPDPTVSKQRGLSEEGDATSRSKGAALMSKLKALSGGGVPSPSGKAPLSPPPPIGEARSFSASSSPVVSRFASRLPGTLTEENSDPEAELDADADAEETADEAQIPESPTKPKKKRRMKRPRRSNLSISSPMSKLGLNGESSFNRRLGRRASMPDTALSEGETRKQLQHRAFRRGSSWIQATMRPPGDDPEDMEESAIAPRRQGHVRRVTVLGGGGISDGGAVAPRRPFFNHSRASTYGVSKWKQVKDTLKLLRQKKEDRVDFFKSAELMAELRAGAPAVLMLASMIQRDEHGNRRIPVLLEQLKVKVKDSFPVEDGSESSERHWIFVIQMEYGSGPSRMSWVIERSVGDIMNLHVRYKLSLKNDKYVPGRLDLGTRLKQPKFPYKSFPYLRRIRREESSDDEADGDRADDALGEAADGEMEPPEPVEDAVANEVESPSAPPRKKSRANLMGALRRRSTGVSEQGDGLGMDTSLEKVARRQRFIDRQRKSVEQYLSSLIRWLMFRADSNRLCRFLELSALGVRLAAEGSYHGKECWLHIQSSKGLDFRRVLTPAKVISRHSRKWFLVRQSYIVCVESPENMHVYDVYLVDSKFSIISKRNAIKQISSKNKKSEIDLLAEAEPGRHHTLTLQTSERKVKLFSRQQTIIRQFEESINEMLKQTSWYQQKRFDSFAPVRSGVFAQWLVDGRDYMWNVSRAINMARDVIYIHDWWLSPELYMRRPAAISQKWRLDRLLQKKAREGVKIFVIVYRNVEAAIPIDSEYTKFSLLNLHPNIFVQRSPNQFKKNQFFFAHHEKICVVDHDVAFVGGIDLCFGRWDSPQHPIADDKPTGFELDSDVPKDAQHVQLFPGKDYSNPRVQDFFRLNEPYEEMYDRSKVPRMPWHDVAMQVVGQPARDLTRHFVQRWNYLRRGRKPTRPLPFLLPPPEAKMDELEALGLTGTCEVQILRSATTWSLGISETEHSIQTAYVRMIEDSEHFVYIENQFFVTSTEVYGTKIHNRIGDALVDRILRANENGEDWKCVIIIPLMPGFQNTVDEQDGTSVRLILMCQFRSICRGENSVFGRLRAAGIDPEEYINFFSLRQWGIMASEALVTEQLYIHAKTIVVDDRVALIGSANINERSMLGSRDSECAAVVRDTEMIWSTMAGKPYQVGRFAHTLRMRLMREHLGLDVDQIAEEERQHELDRMQEEMDTIYQEDQESPAPGPSTQQDPLVITPRPFNQELDFEQAKATMDSGSSSPSSSSDEAMAPRIDTRVTGNQKHRLDVSGYGPDQWKAAEKVGLDEGRDSVMVNGREVLVHNIANDGKGTLDKPQEPQLLSPILDHKPAEPVDTGSDTLPPMPPLDRRTTEQVGFPRMAQLPALPLVDDTDIGGPPVHYDSAGRPISGTFHPMAADIRPALIDRDCMKDPVHPSFMDDVWNRVAANNTKLFRRVFRCMPDSEVLTWNEYREYVEYGERFRASMDGGVKSSDVDPPEHDRGSTSGAAGVGAPGPEAIARVVEEEVKKIVPGLEPAHSNGKNMHGAHHKVGIPESDFNEKQIGNDEPVMSEKHPSLLNTDVEDNISRAFEAPSPVHSQGDVPFPQLEGTGSKSLEPNGGTSHTGPDRRATFSTHEKPPSRDTGHVAPPASAQFGSVKRRRRATTKGSRRHFSIEDMPSRPDAEELLNMIQGNLVQFPYDWLLTEEHNGNWGYQVDGVAPLSIYN